MPKIQSTYNTQIQNKCMLLQKILPFNNVMYFRFFLICRSKKKKVRMCKFCNM